MPRATGLVHRPTPDQQRNEDALSVGIVVIALLWSGAISASGPQTWQGLFGLICPPACLVMVVETLLSFNKYSGRARHHRSAA